MINDFEVLMNIYIITGENYVFHYNVTMMTHFVEMLNKVKFKNYQ